MGRNDRGSCWNRKFSHVAKVGRPSQQCMQVYSGLTFKMSISFPPNYPYAAPTIKFDTPCYHPNVDLTAGAICLDILQVCLRFSDSRFTRLTSVNFRISGPPCTACKRFCCPCSRFLEVRTVRIACCLLSQQISMDL